MTERNPNGQFKSKSPPVLRTLGERIDSLEASLISREESASIRCDLAKMMKTEDEQISLNQLTQAIDDEQRKQIAELVRKVDELSSRVDDDSGNSQSITASMEHSLNGLRRDVASVQVSDIRIDQLSEKCKATESISSLALLASAVLGIVAIVLACVL